MAWAAPLSDPEVDAYNVRVGTQTFAPRYKFSSDTALVETALAIRGMGSDIIKLYLGKNTSGQYGISRPASITNLTALVQQEPSYRAVFDMPFRHYFVWAYCLGSSSDAWWKDGFSASERTAEYNEVYAFARYLLTNYNHSGKSFYLGHWEGDWHLLDGYDATVNPSATAIQGMIDWLNTRQKAVDDARQNTPHTNVFVFHYTEANRVRDAMLNGPTNNQRVINTVVPMVTNLDYVSWSAYDGMNLGTGLVETLDYIASRIPTNKAALIEGKRVILGEYGWGGSLSSAAQESPTRSFIQRVVSWGAPFVLFWQMYDNENRAYWLIDHTNSKTPCYSLHQRFINRAKLLTAQFKETNGRLPATAEFAALTTPMLAEPLPEPIALKIAHLPLGDLTATSAVVEARVEQGVYADEQAAVRVFWGTIDEGTNAGLWQHAMSLGLNTNFNPATFSASLRGLQTGTRYYFRFQMTNANGSAWAPASGQFWTDSAGSARFGSRMQILVTGYDGSEPLENFPLLVSLSPLQAGFDYRQFASPTGGDLRFADASGARILEHEIEQWNTNGVSHVWVRVPVLGGSPDYIWAYWGNPLDTIPPAYTTNGAVWANGFELVWHFKENGYPFRDSTVKHPAVSGTPPAGTSAGMIGRGALYNLAGQYLNAGTVSLGDQCTISAWVWVHPTATSIQTIWANKTGGSVTPGLAFFINSWQSQDGKLILETGNGSAGALAATVTNVVNPGQWRHVAAVVDRAAGSARLFVDGAERSTDAVRTDFATNNMLALGRFTDGLYQFRGVMDEARVETVARSADWIRASWLSAASNMSFLSWSRVIEPIPELAADYEQAKLVVSWPATAVGYRLLSAGDLASAPVWVAVTNQPVLSGDRWQVALAGEPWWAEAERYFRLERL